MEPDDAVEFADGAERMKPGEVRAAHQTQEQRFDPVVGVVPQRNRRWLLFGFADDPLPRLLTETPRSGLHTFAGLNMVRDAQWNNLKWNVEFFTDFPAEFRIGQALRAPDAVFEMHRAEFPRRILPELGKTREQRQAVRTAAEGSVDGANIGRDAGTGKDGAGHGEQTL